MSKEKENTECEEAERWGKGCKEMALPPPPRGWCRRPSLNMCPRAPLQMLPVHRRALLSPCSPRKQNGKERGKSVEPGAAECEGRERWGCSHPEAHTLTEEDSSPAKHGCLQGASFLSWTRQLWRWRWPVEVLSEVAKALVWQSVSYL